MDEHLGWAPGRSGMTRGGENRRKAESHGMEVGRRAVGGMDGKGAELAAEIKLELTNGPCGHVCT